ncbi:DUF6884 domain-containing protein [Vibrio harveyi]|uniref:DUF6884 domain-containing protein n=2 Tax=Vibrio harveyi TaxID=669 RepID=UPI0031BDE304
MKHDNNISRNKPIIIINCSGLKSVHPCKAVDMYVHHNSLVAIFRKYLGSDYQGVDLLILSMKYGLIDAKAYIEPYEAKIDLKDTDSFNDFLNLHHRNSRKLLRALNVGSRPVFVCMVNSYRKALYSLTGDILTNHKWLYESVGHCGIGELRGRLSRVCQLFSKKTFLPEPYRFYSGIVDKSYIETFRKANCNIGSSLYYCNRASKSDLLQELVNVIKVSNHGFQVRGRVFLDNGFHTSTAKGEGLNVGEILNEYQAIYDRYIKIPSFANKMTIVIPDSVDATESISILKVYKNEITNLVNSGYRVVLPVHAQENIAEHVELLLNEIKYPELIALGVPCLRERMYSTADLEKVLTVAKKKGVEAIHFFGISPNRKGTEYPRRVLLAQLYGFKDISCDSTRFKSWFGKDDGQRKGSVLVRNVKKTLVSPRSDGALPLDFELAQKQSACVRNTFLKLIEEDTDRAFDVYRKVMPRIFSILNDLPREVKCMEMKRKINGLRSTEWRTLSVNFNSQLQREGLINFTDLKVTYSEGRKIAIRSLISLGG